MTRNDAVFKPQNAKLSLSKRQQTRPKKKPLNRGFGLCCKAFEVEARAGVEPTYTDLQSD